jgi:hypothetical protein
MFPKHHRNYTCCRKSGALLIAIFGALSVADYNNPQITGFFFCLIFSGKLNANIDIIVGMLISIANKE